EQGQLRGSARKGTDTALVCDPQVLPESGLRACRRRRPASPARIRRQGQLHPYGDLQRQRSRPGSALPGAPLSPAHGTGAVRDQPRRGRQRRDRGSVRNGADGQDGGKGGGGMSDKAASEDALLESFAQEARRRCDVISAGLATATTDFETMRAEAHALRGTAGVVGLRRLAELAGLMESDLAEAKKTGTIRGG